jgi:NitT/TauT family transport system substrate-binding protein
MFKHIALALALTSPLFAQTAPEKPKVILGVGGKALLYYLPLSIAESKGFFKDQGLDVEINDFAGGARSLQALVGGSVDVVAGAFEHTLRMQGKKQDIKAVVEMGRFPAITIAVKASLADKIKSAADFKGLKIGVTAPGSSTNMTVQYAMLKAGLKKDDAAFIGVGGGATAVAQVKGGGVDIISHLEPVISKLEADGDVKVLIDTRTEAGTKALFGGTNPAAVLYLKQDFIDKNPETTQRLVNAIMKANKWIAAAKPEDIMAALPETYALGDKPLFIKAISSSQEAYSRDGIVSEAGFASVYDMLKKLEPEMEGVTLKYSDTFVDKFAKKAQ